MRFIKLVSCAAVCYAYGAVGHWLSGRIAQDFLIPDAKLLVRELLSNYPEGSELKLAATWADEIKRYSKWAWVSLVN
jgi:S1/P1 Nuclease